jgi:superfamily II DNA/RNA helicase
VQLKKINPHLQKALAEHDLLVATELQSATFSTIKSGADCILAAPNGTGKTTAIVLNVIQKLAKAEGESTRALVFAEDKETVLEMVSLFEKYAAYTDLRFLGTHDKGDIDYDKNIISLGLDILIGTPTRINAMFSSAGFNLTTVKIFAVDDADTLFKNRHDAVILRLAGSIVKTQYLFTCETITERVEIMADKIMTEPLFFETGDEEDEE